MKSVIQTTIWTIIFFIALTLSTMKEGASVDGANTYGFPLTFYSYFVGKCAPCSDKYGFKLFSLLIDIGVITIIAFLLVRLKTRMLRNIYTIMPEKLFAVIIKSNVIAIVLSVTIAWINYEATTGLAARESFTKLFVMTIALCVYNFLISLLGLLNFLKIFRNSKILSETAFIGLPTFIFILISMNCFSTINSKPTTNFEFLSLAGPFLFYVISNLTFRIHWKRNINTNNTTGNIN